VTLDVAPKILPTGRTVVPIRFVSENIGAKVDWNATTKMVTVTMAPSKPGTVYKLKLGTIYNSPVTSPSFNAWGASLEKFVALVKEKTGGRVEITPYYSSVLGANDETLQQLRRGELDAFYGQPMSTVDPRFGVFSVPYLFPDYAAVEKLVANPDAPLFKLAQTWMADKNAYLLSSGVAVFRGFFNVKHRVATVSDVRDLKVRIYEDPVVNLFWKSICNAQVMAFSEVYTALQTKTIDGLEFAATSVLSSKYYDLGKYYSNINWQWTWGANLVLSTKVWSQLPDDLKAILSDCAWQAMDVEKTEELANGAKAESALTAQGVEVYHLTTAERQTWIDYARSLDSKMRDAIGPATYDQVMKIIKDSQG